MVDGDWGILILTLVVGDRKISLSVCFDHGATNVDTQPVDIIA